MKTKIEIKIDEAKIKRELTPYVRRAGKLRVRTQIDAVRATEFMAEVSTKLRAVKEEREAVIGPINEKKGQILAAYELAMSPLEAAMKTLKEALLRFQNSQEARNTAKVARALPRMNEGARRATAQAMSPTSYEGEGGQSVFATTWDYEETNLVKIPHKLKIGKETYTFLELNRGEIRRALNNGVRQIPGLRIFPKKSISLRRVEPQALNKPKTKK